MSGGLPTITPRGGQWELYQLDFLPEWPLHGALFMVLIMVIIWLILNIMGGIILTL